MTASSCWHLYVLKTAAGHLYTGITTDVARRLEEHREGIRGAKALRGKGPLILMHHEVVGERGDALRLEAQVKRLSAAGKRAWLEARRDEASGQVQQWVPYPHDALYKGEPS